MKEVYVIISPEGSINLKLGTNKGTCYADKEKAEKALESKNRWSASKGYGEYSLVALTIEE